MKKLFFLMLLTIILGCKENNKNQDTTILYYNGKIITLTSDKTEYAQAAVEENGKIAFVGTLDEAEKQFLNAQKEDLQGKTIILENRKIIIRPTELPLRKAGWSAKIQFNFFNSKPKKEN